jgi:hypothetical protein
LRHCRSSDSALAACTTLAPTPRWPPRPLPSGSSRPASCMVRVEAPRVRLFHRLPNAAAPTADQSTPLCSWKRLSSDSTSAVRMAGEISCRATQSSRRWVMSVRKVCNGAPWRSSSTRSDGRQAALTSSKRGRSAACDATAAQSKTTPSRCRDEPGSRGDWLRSCPPPGLRPVSSFTSLRQSPRTPGRHRLGCSTVEQPGRWWIRAWGAP